MISPLYPSEYFSVIWTGLIKAPTTETYRISINTYNSTYVLLKINNEVQILNPFEGNKATDEYLSVDIDLVKDTMYGIELRYAEKLGETLLQLYWETD